jgi:hypothetical protein
MRRFVVDEVEPANAPLPTQPLGASFPDALAVGGEVDLQVVAHGSTHPLLAAVGLAFAQHRPLLLTPDAVWLTIAQGVAQHVRINAERLRARLVRHNGRERLILPVNAVPDDAAAWAAAVGGFRALLAERIGDGRARLLECDFSTSTDVDRLASQIVLLDAYSPYFSYWLVAVCGIPSITLAGTVEDWKRIRERIDVLAELDLEPWCRSLVPITEQFVRAAGGDVDVAFWRRIYNPADAYGGDLITGWITRFYPYVKGQAANDRPNPMLELPIDEPKLRTKSSKDYYSGPGLRSDSVPATVSRVPVRIVDRAQMDLRAIDLVAGVVAVAQELDGALRPVVGWHVDNAQIQMEDVIERIKRDHVSTPAGANPLRALMGGSAELVAFYMALQRATLFAGERAWRVRSLREYCRVELEGAYRFSLHGFADLPDGRVLCVATDFRTQCEHWFLCRVNEPDASNESVEVLPREAHALDTPSEIPVLAGSFASILDAVLTTGGQIDHLVVGRLDRVLAGATAPSDRPDPAVVTRRR